MRESCLFFSCGFSIEIFSVSFVVQSQPLRSSSGSFPKALSLEH